MKKTARRVLAPTITFAAGVTAATLILAPLNPATAETGGAAKTARVSAVQVSDNSLRAAKANLQTYAATASDGQLDYAAPGGPATKQAVKIGDGKGQVWFNKISSSKLFVNDKDTGWIARYEVQVRRADGKVIFDKNLTVYKMAWFANRFDVDKAYANEGALVTALNNANNLTEAEARATFKKRIGELGVLHEASGDTHKPYDPAEHPGQPYQPLDYEG